jgi:hypothetical protein
MAFVERQDIYTAQRIGDHESRTLELDQALERRGPVAERFRPIRTPGNTWNSVIWVPELGIFSAVAGTGDTKRAMVSEDGEAWTAYETPGANCAWESVAWSPQLGLLVAVASAGDAGERVMTSADGKSWALRTTLSPYQDIAWRGICWSAERGIFVAVASDTGTSRVMTSADGTNWISKTTPLEWASASIQQGSVTWSPEIQLFVAVNQNGTNGIITSSDGETWTIRSAGTGAFPADQISPLFRVSWISELQLFLAVGGRIGSGQSIRTFTNVWSSVDGETWIYIPNANKDAVVRDFVWVNSIGRFCTIATGESRGDAVFRVMNAGQDLAWRLQFTPQARNWRCIEWSPALNKLVILSSDGPGYAGLVSP